MVLVAHDPASARGRLDMEPGRVSLVISYFPHPGSASRRMSSRQQTDTNRSVSARRRRSQSRRARTASRALTGRLADRTPGDRTDRDRSQAVQTGASGWAWVPLALPHRPHCWSGRAHHSGRIGAGSRAPASSSKVAAAALHSTNALVFSRRRVDRRLQWASREIWRDVAQLEQDRKRP